MGEFFSDLARFEYLRNALLAGVLVGGVCSVLSIYVVLRKMAFIGHGISHSALGGISLGICIFGAVEGNGLYIDLVTAAFCLGVAFLIGYYARREKVSEDSAIGIFLVFAVALGVVLLSQRTQFTQEVMTYLFGSIISVSRQDLAVTAVLAAAVLAAVGIFFKELVYFSFDEKMARVSGIPATFLHYFLLAVLALTIVVTVKIVGIILVSAYLVIPGASALLVTERFKAAMAVSAVIGVSTSILGIAVAYAGNFPPGATIVLAQFAVFIVCTVAVRIGGRR